jgi:hypothetical protein
MLDKIIAVLALATMIAFLGVVAVFVPSVDLVVVIVFVSLLASYDFWQALRNNGGTVQR